MAESSSSPALSSSSSPALSSSSPALSSSSPTLSSSSPTLSSSSAGSTELLLQPGMTPSSKQARNRTERFSNFIAPPSTETNSPTEPNVAASMELSKLSRAPTLTGFYKPVEGSIWPSTHYLQMFGSLLD